MHYTRGTELLESGNSFEAVKELEKAVALDPEMARNHSNLCAAYLTLDNKPMAWYHARQAVLCPYRDVVGSIQFLNLFNALVVEESLDQPGVSEETILERLGSPDNIVYSEKTNAFVYQYGLALFIFKDKKLTKLNFIDPEI